MPQLFSRRALFAIKLALVAGVVLLTAMLAAWKWIIGPRIGMNVAPRQPIPFSHAHHVGDDGIDCRYCHTSVETSASAGMPSTSICLTCHSVLFRSQPMLAPLHRSLRRGVPIRWVRVYDLPDFVYFNHSIHVNKGVGCIECHGRVDRMPLMRRVSSLDMQWCLGCHRNPAPHLRPPAAVFDPHAVKVRDPQALVRFYRLKDARRLTDCSTCHR